MPFSFSIDVLRAKKGAEAKGYKVVDKGMIIDTGGMFMSQLMVEVENADPSKDKNVVSLVGKNLYTKASSRPWKEMGKDMKELEEELGGKPKELYIYYGACPKCVEQKEVKTVYIAVI